VAGDEALTSLTIKAVSVLNPEKYGEATVTVEAPPEPVLPAPKGANALSGKTYFDRDAKIYFSPTAPGAASGTYTKKAVLYTYNEDVNRPSEPVLDANGKYTWVETATGAYSWDADAKKVTLAPEKAAPSEDGYGYGPLETKSQYRVSVQEMLDQYTQEEEEELSAQLQSLGFSSIEEYLDRAVEYTFKNVTNNYALSADNKALFLDELLPANKGSNELAGNTYYDTTWDSGAGQEVRDESATYVFATDGSCAYTYHGGTPQTYSYAFDRDARKVYLKVPTTERQTAYVQSGSVYNAQYYDSQDDAKAAEVNGRYNRIDVYTYDTPDLTLRFRPF
jgi:hypothetical protein